MPDNAYNYCALPVQPELSLPPNLGVPRERAIRALRTKWVNGTTLRYYFFTGQNDGSPAEWAVPAKQQTVIREAFDTWQKVGIGLNFTETTDRSDAEVRIGFMDGDGSWSYVGRDILQAGTNDRTMNFGWDLTEDDYGMTTAIHEIGHTIGMPHEHQNPFSGIVWDEAKVYAFLSGPPNSWSREMIFHNVLRKLSSSEVEGSAFDGDSVMEYSFPPGLILQPEKYKTGGIKPPGTISALDRQYVQIWYPPQGPAKPPVLKPFQSAPLTLGPGQQADFTLEPTDTRNYRIGTFGDSDTVLVVFEEVDGALRQLAADDDSGEERNALIETKLFQGRRYVLRTRLYYAWNSGGTAVMYW
jgi:hypothetical protein